MHDLSKTILESYQARKTKKQKDAFIQLLKRHYPDLRTEECGKPKSRNLIIGDVDTAEVVLTAHYDTCPASPFPNLLVPMHPSLRYLYTFLTLLPIIIIVLTVNAFIVHHSSSELLRICVVMGLYVLLFCLQFFGGTSQRPTANDNTSGVITLIETLEQLPSEMRGKAAFVFFDNEELGCKGSAAFRKLYKAQTENKLIFNFDCVADGDHFLFVSTDAAQKKWEPLLQKSFSAPQGKQVSFANAKQAKYSSDQKHFPVSIGAAALHRHPLLGLYCSRIHTKRDTIFQEENIRFLSDGVLELLRQLAPTSA